jgi:AbrB family looped-hinge helix DNA binding protein
MLRRIISVSTKGELVIPSEMRMSLGIEPGTRMAVTQDGSRIVLETVSEELVERPAGSFRVRRPSSTNSRGNAIKSFAGNGHPEVAHDSALSKIEFLPLK